MGLKRCAVNGCASASNRTEDVGVTFHQLPAKSTTRTIWIKGAGVPDDANVKVCSRHFREADFKVVKQKYYLVKGTYPTIFPWGVFVNGDPNTEAPQPQPTAVVKEEPQETTETAAAPQTAEGSPSLPVARAITSTVKDKPKAAAAIRVKKETKATKRHSIATVDAVKLEPAEEVTQKPLRKSMEAVATAPKKEPDPPKAKLNLEPGQGISAMDFQNVWHPAQILEVDSVEREVLIHFEDDNDQKLVDEWIPMDSSRLRALIDRPETIVKEEKQSQMAGGTLDVPRKFVEPKYKINEKVLARWSDSRKFKATVQKILPNGLYEVIFDDGFVKTVKLKHMAKLKNPRTPQKKTAGLPLPSVSLVDGEEWFCQWVDDCPMGQSATLEGVPAQVRVVEVKDPRLPPGWLKLFSERIHGGSKWDVVVVAPCGRRFRGRQDVRAYIEETGNTKLNLADFDFAMHKKRAKEKGVYTYTDNYRKLLKSLYPSMTEIDTIPTTPADIQEIFMAQQPALLMEPIPEAVVRDWIMVDGMKVQIIDNLLRCPEEGCFKNFRKENLLKMHIKHYHETMAKKISDTPTMCDLAAKRQSLVEVDEGNGLSPAKGMRKNPEKLMRSPMEVGMELTEESGSEQKPTTSILEQALNAGVVIKSEDGVERVYPRPLSLNETKPGKRKYVRKAISDDPRLPKKLKLEPLDTTLLDDSMSMEMQHDGTQVPKEYINEHGELIKIVRMRKEEIINCLCNYPEEDGLMIQCDLCLCWQHGRCNDIEKESQVPDKYVCYICRNPERGRESMRYVHDQDWLLDGKLPRGTYHTQGTMNDAKRMETLKRINTLTGNLLELKRLMYSLRVKLSIADNKDHPKLYLWSKRWEEPNATAGESPVKGVVVKEEPMEENGPKPEAAIDPRECQQRLMDHIKYVQAQLASRMDDIERYVDELEGNSELGPMTEEEDAKFTPRIKQSMHMMMDDLNTMKEIALC